MTVATDQTDSASLAAKSVQVLAMRERMLAAWESQVRASVRGADLLLRPILINTLPAFFDNLAEALSPDYPRADATSNTTIAAAHGNERARMTSYGPEQVIQEYQIFRDVFASEALATGVVLGREEWRVINQSIDLAVLESVREFSTMQEGFRRRIAAGLSHDMRNPLSVMVTCAQVLSLGCDPAHVLAIGQKIIANGNRLDEMIRELLDALSVQRAEALPLALSEFDMRDLAGEVVAEVNDRLPGKCTLLGDPVQGHWCRDSMRRALENLLTNAVKYGDQAPIRVKIDATLGRLILSVHNTGKPIPPEHTGKIFDYLWRERGSAAGGWGIGLPFVQGVAESHGGSVAVDSGPATGTTFIIDVPVDCRPFVARAVA